MKYEIKELKKFIDETCKKNISQAAKDMAFSHLARIEARFRLLLEMISETEYAERMKKDNGK